MNYSDLSVWESIIEIGIIAFLLLAANMLRKIPFIRNALLPTSVLAGFLLLGLKYIPGMPIENRFLELITYHGLALGFIALSLRVKKTDVEKDESGFRTAVNSGALIVSTYLIQGIIGVSVSLLAAYTFMPDFFKASGLLLCMGFGQGPGQANNIGSTYENLGFIGGRSYGLAIAATGFLVACIVGVIYLNVESKKGRIVRKTPKELSGSVTIETFQDEGEIEISQSVDKLSIQAALIVFVYIFTFGMIKLVTTLLGKYAPGVSNLLSPIFWGFNFIFGSLFAVATRKVMARMKKLNILKHQYQNNYLLNRISGLCFDLMIICGIAAIDFADLQGLWIPFAITVVLGAIGTFLYLKFMTKILYKGYEQEAFLGMFGMLTGTISSGILLVREVDPEFNTPAANNLVTGSGTAVAFGAPVLLFVGLAAKSTAMLFIVYGIMFVYTAILLLIMLLKKKKKVN
ncbi:MAG: hypothetical protein K6G52_05425 [Treponemataceae bacterium]|nr:hypothetical protein [Treponemataceae bacterium]